MMQHAAAQFDPAYLALALESSGAHVKMLSLDGVILALDSGGSAAMGFSSPDAIVGLIWFEFLQGETRQAAETAVAAAARGLRSRFAGTSEIASGEKRWWDNTIVPLPEGSSQPTRLLAVSRDVTASHAAESALERSARLEQALVEAISQIVWQVDVTTGVSTRRGYLEFTGRPDDASNMDGWLEAVHPDDRDRAKQAADAADKTGTPFTMEYRLFHVSGQWRWVEDSACPVTNEVGTITDWVGIITDIHERKCVEEEIWRAAHLDSLTGIANRGSFHLRLDESLAEAARHGTGLGLLLVDLDRFKEVNDTLGHDAGDAMLQVVAGRIGAMMPPGTTVGRLGGDEFGVVVPGGTGLAVLADSIVAALSQPFAYAGWDIDCSASVGWSTYPSQAQQSSTLLKNADMALYAAKAAGRSRATMYEPAMGIMLEKRRTVLRCARDALDRDAIVPFYQPKVSLRSGEIIGFEALLRWSDGSRLRSPGEIGEALNDPELSDRLGLRMLECIMADMQAWNAEGLPFGHVALNVATSEFQGGKFCNRITDALLRSGVQPSQLEIEVTERVLMDDETGVIKTTLQTLHEAGIAVALDDFGTGFASLAHLTRFPVSWVKIDRSFTADLGASKSAAAIVQAVIGLAHGIDSKVTAEGIETRAQLEFLIAAGCDLGQGFLLAKPMSRSRVRHFIETWDWGTLSGSKRSDQLRKVARKSASS